MKFDAKNKPLTIFSFSSLTDIVMLLLIFFLLTSQFVIQTGVKVKLPGAKNNEQSPPSRLVVTITEDLTIYYGKEQIALESLAGFLSFGMEKSKENTLFVRADRTVDIAMVIKVIDAAKGVGITKFVIETEKEAL